MPAFTLTLRQAIESTGGKLELQPNGVSKLIGGDIGLQWYPIFDENYRDGLTGRICDHFMVREIGFETVELFRLKMRSHMNNVMPYFNKLYESERIVFDPMHTIDLRTLSTGVSEQNVVADGETNAESTTNAKSRTVQSETPQTMLAGNEDYASAAADAVSANDATSNGSEHNTSKSDATQQNDSHVTGYQGSPSQLIMDFREQMLNVDLMLFNDLEPLFMQIWDTSDAYFTRGY